MKHYCQHLQYKYESLKLTSPDEMLDCCSSHYISLTLLKFDDQITNDSVDNEKEKGDDINLSKVLDLDSGKQNVILFEGGPGMGKSTYIGY